MTSKAVALQGGLAVVGLVAAYITWQRQPELQAGEVFVLDRRYPPDVTTDGVEVAKVFCPGIAGDHILADEGFFRYHPMVVKDLDHPLFFALKYV